MATDVAVLLGPLLENSRVAMTVVDAQGRLTLFNKAAEVLTGYAREEVIGKPLSMFYESREDLDEITKTIIEQGKIEDFETTLLSKSGEHKPVSILVTALHDSTGSFVGSIGLTVDISGRKSLEEEVHRQKQRVFFYNDLLCHDILNFCQAGIGVFEILLEDEDLTAEQRRLLNLCMRQHFRTRDLIKRVRMLTALETTGDDGISSTPVGPVLAEAVDALLESCRERQIDIHAPDVPDLHVLASPLLVDCIENVLTNGVVHNTSARPTLWIHVREVDRDSTPFIEIAIEDNGPGIPDDRKEQVFQRYTSMNARGSGVGLSLVKALVEEFGGSVWVEDRVAASPDQGARLVLLLRRAVQ